MKKVRFVSPVRSNKISTMHDSECHSPRPFIQKQVKSASYMNYLDYRPVPFTNDPVQRFENGNSSPYPSVNKTSFSSSSKLENRWNPSNELDLSYLDSSNSTPMNICTKRIEHKPNQPMHNSVKTSPLCERNSPNILTCKENTNICDISPYNVLKENDDFFLRRENLKLGNELHKLHLGKENNPLTKKQEIMMMGPFNKPFKNAVSHMSNKVENDMDTYCSCHHCENICKTKQKLECLRAEVVKNNICGNNIYNVGQCKKKVPQYACCTCNSLPVDPCISNCHCNTTQLPPSLPNSVDKKTWLIEKYHENKSLDLEVEKQNNVTIGDREPTVADLFKIIKMQSEQLQLLQEKVDRFISANKYDEQRVAPPIQNYLTEQVALKSVESEQKISIGVMTSFEVVRTSTIINKEFVKQSEAQIQCNRSQISIKEVVSKQPVNLNFLDGITPKMQQSESGDNDKDNHFLNNVATSKNMELQEEKTLNEMSLYNVQVDNTTPNMSPEQSLYLDIRDYSDSDASSDDQSNVGWTYYNKVMTHVNGMLQESDMPSSASALYRDVRKKCLQMQVDKSNISIAKRVTFGDDPLGLQKPHIQPQTTDTSLKMNQLAAKYLKNAPLASRAPLPTVKPSDMSLATKNYMEKHRILKGSTQTDQPQVNIPKFLDITALKQQTKLV